MHEFLSDRERELKLAVAVVVSVLRTLWISAPSGRLGPHTERARSAGPPPSESCPRFPLPPPRLPRPLLMKPFVSLEPFLAPSCRCLTKAARAPRGKQEGLSFLLLLQDPVQLLESRCGCRTPGAGRNRLQMPGVIRSCDPRTQRLEEMAELAGSRLGSGASWGLLDLSVPLFPHL